MFFICSEMEQWSNDRTEHDFLMAGRLETLSQIGP